MDSEDLIVYCDNCGAEMKMSQRNCLKCGTLNYEHPDNQSMKKYLPKKQKQKYTYVPSTSSTFFVSSVNSSEQSFDKKTITEKKYRRKKLIIYILILFVILVLGYFLYPYFEQIIDKIKALFSDFLNTISNY